MDFNKSQVSAIQHKDGPMLVLAGPGSGKTAVITERTYNLIENYSVDPGHILVITFTKAAATEMKQRFMKRMQQDRCRVSFGTFHAIFFMMLKHAYHFESGNVIGEDQKYLLLREIIAHHHLEYRDENEFIGNLLGEISRIKNERMDIAHFYSACCGEEVFRNIYREYNQRLQENRWIDFDDMLLYTYELFCARKDILAQWQAKYQYILIDEFQDINRIQFEIVRMLAAKQENLFVVGDDDQSIYRFRGSKPELMLQFTKAYPKAKQVVLDVNYRSDANIVQDSLQLISYNKARFEKHIQAQRAPQHKVRYVTYENQRRECLAILAEIQKGIQNGDAYQEYAVLYRTNTQPRLLTELLMEQNLPFRMKDYVPNLYEHWIARDVLTYIRVAKGSRTRADMLQIMNRPKRYIGRDSLESSTVAFDVWQQFYETKQPWIAERIEELHRQILILGSMSPYAAINYIRKGIGYDGYLEEYAKYRNLNYEELAEVLEELQETARGYKSYEEWQRHIEEYSQNLRQAAKSREENPNSIMLSTLHGAKGLEFEHVYLLDVNEGILPYKKAVLDADMEEERRLFYVGMTRAKSYLTVCSLKAMKDKNIEPSRFLMEARGLAKKEDH